MGAAVALMTVWLQLSPAAGAGSVDSSSPSPSRAMSAIDSLGVVSPADTTATPGAAGAAVPSFTGSTAADSLARNHSTSEPRPKKRSVGGRATHTVKSFVSDLGYVIVSPFRLKANGLLFTLGGLGVTALTYSYDDEIMRGFDRSEGNPTFDSVIDVGDQFVEVGFMGHTWPYWVGGAVLSTAFDVDPVQSICLDVIESHLIAGGARNIGKLIFGRRHPFETTERSKFFDHGSSAPSGHTSVVFEIATVLTRHTDGWPVPARVGVGVVTYGVATAVGMQRVATKAHWASDCVAAALQGTTIANTVVSRNKERRKKEGIAQVPTLVPTLDASGQPAFALVWRF